MAQGAPNLAFGFGGGAAPRAACMKEAALYIFSVVSCSCPTRHLPDAPVGACTRIIHMHAKTKSEGKKPISALSHFKGSCDGKSVPDWHTLC